MESIKNAANMASEKTKEAVAGSKQEYQQDKAQDSSQPIGERLGATGEAAKEAGSKYVHKAEGEADKQELKS
jgi:hypothetical protein